MTAKLLLVDDDPDLAVALRVLCRRAGHTLAVAATVADAWQALHAARPDLLLLDVNLPGVSGLTLLPRLRDDAALHTVPVALHCQGTLTPDLAAGWAAGADYLVAKELVARPDSWQARIAEVLAHAAGQQGGDSLDQPVVAMRRFWGDILRNTLKRLVPAVLAIELVSPVLRRAFQVAFGSEVAASCFARGADRGVVLPDGAAPKQVQAVFQSLADQVERLHGPRARADCADLLRAESGG